MKFKHKKSDRYLVRFKSQNGTMGNREILCDDQIKNMKSVEAIAKCIVDSNSEVSVPIVILSIVKFPIK